MSWPQTYRLHCYASIERSQSVRLDTSQASAPLARGYVQEDDIWNVLRRDIRREVA